MRRTTAELAHISRPVLKWAIHRSGESRTAVAKRVGIKEQTLNAWESGPGYPTFDQAIKLADVLGIPLGYFYLQEPPPDEVPVPDRRQLRSSKPLSPNFKLILNDVLVRQDWFRSFLEESNERPLPFVGSVKPSANVEDVATNIRESLHLSPELRRTRDTYIGYLGALAEQAERARILVMRSSIVRDNTHKSVSRDEVQGFALADPMAPVIFVNSSDYKSAQVFTFAHELAHLWIGQSAISNPEEGERRRVKTEEFCNLVAAETLAPRPEVIAAWKVGRGLSVQIQVLARQFWVSEIVMARRANEIGLISKSEFVAIRKTLVGRQRVDDDGGGDYYRNLRQRNSYRLTDTLITEVNRGRVMLREAADLLGMNVQTLAVFAEGASYP